VNFGLCFFRQVTPGPIGRHLFVSTLMAEYLFDMKEVGGRVVAAESPTVAEWV
jgi:hypothetical protein